MDNLKLRASLTDKWNNLPEEITETDNLKSLKTD